MRTVSIDPRADVEPSTGAPDIAGALPDVRAGGPVHWLRAPFPVIDGRTDTPWMTIMKLVDSATGLGTGLAPDQWNFMNIDTTVYLHRLPVGEWIGLLPDATGPVGTADQPVLLTPR